MRQVQMSRATYSLSRQVGLRVVDASRVFTELATAAELLESPGDDRVSCSSNHLLEQPLHIHGLI
jgi:hypothetical protein